MKKILTLVIIVLFVPVFSYADLTRTETSITKQEAIVVRASVDKLKHYSIDVINRTLTVTVASGNVDGQGVFTEVDSSSYDIKDLPAKISGNSETVTIASGTAILAYPAITNISAISTDGTAKMYSLNDHYSVSGTTLTVLDTNVLPDGTQIKVIYDYESVPATTDFTDIVTTIDGTKPISLVFESKIWAYLLSKNLVSGTVQ